mmetsp:Transcript_15605/g.35018  ORF Transcript_15605/g.35018 Transcript_15605/m.35018 type:complete len:373 (-) Transcript_15605:71-1189(-)
MSTELRYRGTRAADVSFLEANAKKDGVVVLESGLQYKVLREVIIDEKELKKNPKKKPPQRPKRATPCKCHYKGTFVDGTEFDNSHKRGKPTVFAPNQVIPAWMEAMLLMREGEKWEIYAPAHLAYGDDGAGEGAIPGGAALIFELDMVQVDCLASQDWPWWIIWALVVGTVMLAVHMFVTQARPARGAPIRPVDAQSEDNPRVFFDIRIGDYEAGRVEFELFSNVAPKAAENFRALCTGEKGLGKSGKPLHYKNTKFHRIIPGFMVQGGDITRGNGMGGESIFGRIFRDEWENGWVKHSVKGLLSMANRGKDTNGSQFFITVAPTSHLDGKHVVFGRVVSGLDVVDKIEAAGSDTGSPDEDVTIVNSGEVNK